MQLRFLKRLPVVTCLTAVVVAASASPATASVTIGQTGTPSVDCAEGLDAVQPTVTAGNAYVVPATGTMTSWSTIGNNFGGVVMAMKVFRKVADPATYMAVGHDGPRPLDGGSGFFYTFTGISVPVRSGDVLGLHTAGTQSGCVFSAPGETSYSLLGNLTDGQSGAFTAEGDHRLNISAVVDPSNSFTLGKVKRNKKKGIATLTVNVPNPGELALSGKGVKRGAKTVTAPGDVKLKIRPKASKKRTLDRKGKAKVRPDVTFTPTGGDPSSQSRNFLKLKKR